MSLLPALMALFAVMLAVVGAASMSRDGGLAAVQQADRQLARHLAEAALERAAAAFEEVAGDDDASPSLEPGIAVEAVPTADRGEIGDLPLRIRRVTAVAEHGRSRVRLQADYAVQGCESVHDDPCTPQTRRLAWRELPAE